MSSDAADKGVHALEMRFRLKFCGASKKPPYGRVMELADVPDSKSGVERRAGSSPALGTSNLGSRQNCSLDEQ